jgi:hypothetical protein
MPKVRARYPCFLEDGSVAQAGEVYEVSEGWAALNSNYLVVEPERKKQRPRRNKKLRSGENK